ncbi:MAG: 50S ribosomal protein L21 [Candidatus Dojkabacteria bacterium]|nr:MAG: 50S ribosomal protein L21 [Candidatus Dojkabacteria bacterium]
MTDYAIVNRGKHQYFLVKGKYIDIPKVKAEKTEKYTFEEVLLTNVKESVQIGQPHVKNASVVCTVVKHFKSKKEEASKFKAKSRYRKQWGYRQQLTRLMVEDIVVK